MTFGKDFQDCWLYWWTILLDLHDYVQLLAEGLDGLNVLS